MRIYWCNPRQILILFIPGEDQTAFSIHNICYCIHAICRFDIWHLQQCCMLCCQIIHSRYWYHRTLIASWHEWMTGCTESSNTGMHQLNEEVSCWYITQSDTIKLVLYIHISHINIHLHMAYRYLNVITPEYIVHGTRQFSYKCIFNRYIIYQNNLCWSYCYSLWHRHRLLS